MRHEFAKGQKTRESEVKDVVRGLMRDLEKTCVKKKDAVVLAWETAAGEKVVRHAKPVSFRKGTMVVVVENSTWLYTLTLEKKQLIQKFNDSYTGKSKLEEIRYRVGEMG